MIDLFTTRQATFSDDRKYRYTLSIQWDKELPTLNFLMLNPSTADEFANDPTVERCERRARQWGYGRVVITNIFAFRSTDPSGLWKCDNPVGEHNDLYILDEALCADKVICAWGTNGLYMNRASNVMAMLIGHGVKPHYLKLTKDGEPCHPLYLPYTLEPKPYA